MGTYEKWLLPERIRFVAFCGSLDMKVHADFRTYCDT
jgi:hypothetical protein